jgi:hypothetical protein
MLTWRNDNSRSGVNSQELVLTPRTVTSSTFGRLFTCPLDGYAYAQPLYVANLAIPGNGTRNVLFVATENDSVYAFDADASPCVQLWKTTLTPTGSQAVSGSNLGTNSVSPVIGITGTPVISSNASALYVVAKTMTNVVNLVYSQTLYALDLATGKPKFPEPAPAGVPITAQGMLLPLLENQRAALVLDNVLGKETIYIAFGSYDGLGTYHGWLLGYDGLTLQPTSAFSVTPPNSFGGGIWQSGGGPAVDANHNIFVLTGDGPFDVNRGGTSYSNSFLRLGTMGALTVSDYFTPCDGATPGAADFGASAPLLLPDSAGSGSAPHLAVSASKGGSLYVENRDSLGGFDIMCQRESLPRVQVVPVADGPILSTPIFWNGSIYVAAGNGKLKSFPMSGGVLATTPSGSQSAESFGPLGATPTISSSGTNNAILWLIDSSGALPAPTPSTPAILRAFDPDNSLYELYNSGAAAGSRDTAGAAVKFSVPTVANGKVYVGTQTELDVYGLLP